MREPAYLSIFGLEQGAPHWALCMRIWAATALRQCRRQEESIRADRLAADLLDKDYVQFWRDVKTQSLTRVPLLDSVDGYSGPTAVGVCGLSSTLCPSTITRSKEYLLWPTSRKLWRVLNGRCSPWTRLVALLRSSNGGRKAAGPDCLSPEHRSATCTCVNHHAFDGCI